MNILIATDGLPPANHAIHEAARLLAAAGADVLLVSVLDPEQHTGGNQDAQADIEAGLAILRSHGIHARGELLRGHYAEAILHRAESLPADVIVVGSDRSSPLVHLLTGSVSTQIVRKFKGAVLVVPLLHHE